MVLHGRAHEHRRAPRPDRRARLGVHLLRLRDRRHGRPQQASGTELPGLLARLRARTSVPLAVGFGISTPQQAAEVAGLADGVIVGSALIDLIARSASTVTACETVERRLRELSAAMASKALPAAGTRPVGDPPHTQSP